MMDILSDVVWGLFGAIVFICLWETFSPKGDKFSDFLTYILMNKNEREKASYEEFKTRVEEELKKINKL